MPKPVMKRARKSRKNSGYGGSVWVPSKIVDFAKGKTFHLFIFWIRLTAPPFRRFAFVDFTTTEHATSALINPRNHTLDGRKLVVEYASADAVRRGAPKPKRGEGEIPRRGGGAYRGGSRGSARSAGPRGIRLAERASRAAEPDYSEPSIPTTVQSEGEPVAAADGKRSFGGPRPERREKGPRVRPKPGAALALAKRESAAIVPMQGQKITF